VFRGRKTCLKAHIALRKPLVLEFPTWESNKRKLVNQALGTTGLRGSAITDELERQGYDGVILDYAPVGYRHKEVVVFDVSQIEITDS
jgi:hypothetical protein